MTLMIDHLASEGSAVARWHREETLQGFDTIVLTCVVAAINEALKEVEGKVNDAYIIGDAAKPSKGLDAIRDGAEVGR
jgi:hypothetical protein